MRDKLDRYQVHTVPSVADRKRLGGYLVEAGLLTRAQVDVALNDQKVTGMRFGEILAARGWVKQQTIDYLMKKVVVPERKAIKERNLQAQQNSLPAKEFAHKQMTPTQKPQSSAGDRSTFNRKDAPISKPLPPVNSSDNDVSWVG